MPIARFQMPDGRIGRFEVPDGTTPEQAQSMISSYVGGQQEQPQTPEQNKALSWSDVPLEALKNTPQSAGNFLSGIYQAVRHPLDTSKALLDVAAGGLRNIAPEQIQKSIDQIDWNPEATQQASRAANAVGSFYKNRYGSEKGIKNALATDPIGVASDLSTVLSGGAALAPKASKLASILRTGAEFTNPINAVAKPAGVLGTAASAYVMKPLARRIMQSAVKPTIEQLRKGDAATAVDTLLNYGINPSAKGVEKLRSMVDDINSQVAEKISASPASVKRNDVMDYLGNVKEKFANQVSPTSDLNAIAGVAEDFAKHPAISGNEIPVQLAQLLKQGTYKTLAGKYGEAGSAATEAQKALARGLREKISEAVPGVGALNAEEANLLKTLSVAERRALMELNKNPVGLSSLAHSPLGFAAFMADRSAAFKAIVARMLNRSAGISKTIGEGIQNIPQGAAMAPNLASQAGNVTQR